MSRSVVTARNRWEAVDPLRDRRPGAVALAVVAAGLAGALLLAGGPSAGAAPAPRSATGAQAAAAPAPRSLATQFHGLWPMYNDSQRVWVLNHLQAAGVKYVRMDMSWIMLQPRGRQVDPWGVAFIDRTIKMANQRGIKPVITFWLTPSWANGGRGDRVLPYNFADYANALHWAAGRWKGKVLGWEIWNEPNSSHFMYGADPAAYARLLKAAYPAVKSADPHAWVVTGGVQYADTAWLTRVYDAGGKGSFDSIGVNPYMGVADLTPTAPDDGSIYRLSHVATIRRLMYQRGDGSKPIWFMEFGYSTHSTATSTPNWARGVTEATQAVFLTRTAAYVGAHLPYVTKVFWHSDRDVANGDPHYANFGLFRRDMSPKPALASLAASNRAAAVTATTTTEQPATGPSAAAPAAATQSTSPQPTASQPPSAEPPSASPSSSMVPAPMPPLEQSRPAPMPPAVWGGPLSAPGHGRMVAAL